MKYVVGFLHNGKDRVVLVKKNRPEWQAGKLNGLGGKIEVNESASQAMKREFEEEAGMKVDGWHHYAYVTWNGGDEGVYFFEKKVPTTMLYRAKTMESEPVKVYKVSKLKKEKVISNLTWLLPLAMLEQKYNTMYISES